MRALEDAVLDPAAKPSPEVLRSVRALGTASPLRARLEDGSELLSGDEPVVDLGLVTNLSTFDVARSRPSTTSRWRCSPWWPSTSSSSRARGGKWFRKWMRRSTRYIPMMQPMLEPKGCRGTRCTWR